MGNQGKIDYLRHKAAIGSYGVNEKDYILDVCDLAERAMPTRAEEMEAAMFVNQLMATHDDKYDWPNVKSWLRRMLPDEPPPVEHKLSFVDVNSGGARIECSCRTILIAPTLHEVIIKAVAHAGI